MRHKARLDRIEEALQARRVRPAREPFEFSEFMRIKIDELCGPGQADRDEAGINAQIDAHVAAGDLKEWEEQCEVQFWKFYAEVRDKHIAEREREDATRKQN